VTLRAFALLVLIVAMIMASLRTPPTYFTQTTSFIGGYHQLLRLRDEMNS
jgi:hypothetical protein